ncbi:hypothetical protein J2W97_001120 [Paenibacillus jamilae]|nr:hypothetical protein [Paenibacillus jamilae]
MEDFKSLQHMEEHSNIVGTFRFIANYLISAKLITLNHGVEV